MIIFHKGSVFHRSSVKIRLFSDSGSGVCVCLRILGQHRSIDLTLDHQNHDTNCVSVVMHGVVQSLSFWAVPPIVCGLISKRSEHELSSHLICLESQDFLPLSCLKHGWNESTDNSDVTLSVCDGLLLTALTWCRNGLSVSPWFGGLCWKPAFIVMQPTISWLITRTVCFLWCIN